MKNRIAICFFLLLTAGVFAGNVQKTFTFGNASIQRNGTWQTVTFGQTMPAGLRGEPMLPYHQVAMMLPPGEKAVSISIEGENLAVLPGTYELMPQQSMQPLSKGPDGIFLKNEQLYHSDINYPSTPVGHLINSYLNGYSFALSTFTPVIYNPARKTVSYYQKVTVKIVTAPDDQARLALKNLTASENALKRVRLFAQNPEMMNQYPHKSALKSNYKILILTTNQFVAGFQPLLIYYNSIGKMVQVVPVESLSSFPGQDMAEKMRNFIIQEYQANGIEHVILGGDAELIPYRGMYCYVISGSGYEDYNIPADIYFSALDGNWNTNGDNKWGEPGEDDLLPEISVGRMSFSDATEQAHMVHKSISYQSTPVIEDMKKPFLVSEFLYDPPLTYGSDYLELLVDSHSDNGYFTHGIPSTQNSITRLYDTSGYNWGTGELLADINAGKQFIHHCGHANATYMMRLSNWDITDANFSMVDGVHHNYELMYTHGCICGAFDESDCIAELCTSISNFLVGGVFNSRYGWFDQGTTEGPSAHLHREFISAIYHPVPDSAITELGSAHTMSKIKTAPWIGLPGEFEPGAQRWCHYDCNVLGDPALKIWIENPVVGTPEHTMELSMTVAPNPCREHTTLSATLSSTSDVTITVLNELGSLLFSKTEMQQTQGIHSYPIDLGSLPAGIYFIRLDTGNSSRLTKVIATK